MDAISLIEQDLKRRPRSAAQAMGLAALFALGVAFAPVLMGLGLRDAGAYDSARVLIPNGIAALALGLAAFACFRKSFSSASVFSAVRWGLVLCLFLGIERVFFPPGGERTAYASTEVFWRESERCFIKGVVTSGILGLWLGVFAYGFSPWPSRRWRALLSVVAGIAGAIMLGFHCDSSSFEHVLVGHLGQGVVAGLAVYGAQEILFLSRLKSRSAGLLSRIRNPRRLG